MTNENTITIFDATNLFSGDTTVKLVDTDTNMYLVSNAAAVQSVATDDIVVELIDNTVDIPELIITSIDNHMTVEKFFTNVITAENRQTKTDSFDFRTVHNQSTEQTTDTENDTETDTSIVEKLLDEQTVLEMISDLCKMMF